jgi:hypothetical protein
MWVIGSERKATLAPGLDSVKSASNAPHALERRIAMNEKAANFLRSFSNWMDRRRITTHAAIAAAVMWSMFVFSLSRTGLLDRVGNLKGADFLQFYAAGLFARAHRIGAMYGVYQFAAATNRVAPGIQGWHYLPVYPPQVALFFWPLSYFPYLTAFALWSAINVLLYFACLEVVARRYRKLAASRTTLILAAAFPPFFYAVGDGQVSMLALVCVVGSLSAFWKRDEFLAGLALGCTAFKPPIFVAFVVVCLAVRAVRLIGGMAVAAAAQLLLVLAISGFDSMAAYIRFAMKLPRVDRLALAVKPYQMHSMRSFWMLLGVGRLEIALWLLSSIAILVILARYWRREPRADLRFAALVFAAVLIDPHLYIYDAVILAPALIIAIEHARVLGNCALGNALRLGVYALFVCFFAAPLSRITQVQFSVLILVGLFLMITSRSRPDQQSTSDILQNVEHAPPIPGFVSWHRSA